MTAGRRHILRESLEFPRIFFVKSEVNAGDLSVKMDSRVRGNDGGDTHILRKKLILEFSQIFFVKNEVNAGICR